MSTSLSYLIIESGSLQGLDNADECAYKRKWEIENFVLMHFSPILERVLGPVICNWIFNREVHWLDTV